MSLVGHELQMERLRRGVLQGKLASAYLFCGPEGIGKAALARWFAQLLSCNAPERPCGLCARCMRLAEGACPDLTVFEDAGRPMVVRRSQYPGTSLQELDAALSDLLEAGVLGRPARGLGEVRVCSLARSESASGDPEEELASALKGHEARSLPLRIARTLLLRGGAVRYARSPKIELVRRYVVRQAPLRPVEMPYRFFLLDDAHNLQVDSQNTLLKTLEEPPPSTVLLLVSSRPSQLLPTIRSRCQSVALRAVPADAMLPVLLESGAAPEDARLAATMSGGSVLAALQFDPAEHRRQRDALVDGLRQDDGRTLAVGRLVRALGAPSGAERQDRSRQASEKLALMLELLRDAIVLAGGAGAGAVRHHEAETQLRLLARAGPRRLQRLVELALDLQQRLATNASPDLQLLALATRVHETLAG
jgi:DNA polymerase III subunit delta'